MAQRVLHDRQLAVNRGKGAKWGGSGVMVLQGSHGKIIIDEPVIKEPRREDIEAVYRVLVECLLNQHRREQMVQEVKVN